MEEREIRALERTLEALDEAAFKAERAGDRVECARLRELAETAAVRLGEAVIAQMEAERQAQTDVR